MSCSNTITTWFIIIPDMLDSFWVTRSEKIPEFDAFGVNLTDFGSKSGDPAQFKNSLCGKMSMKNTHLVQTVLGFIFRRCSYEMLFFNISYLISLCQMIQNSFDYMIIH